MSSDDTIVNEDGSSLSPLLLACVEDGLVDYEVALAVEGFKTASGVGILRSLKKLGLLKKNAPADRCLGEDTFKPLFLCNAPDADLTFDNYVVSKNNTFPVDVAKRVAGGEASSAYNPLYIYSGVGVGKTHLLSAIANGTELDVMLVNAADLQAEYERARRLEFGAEFRCYLLAPSILLVDDVQFCQGNEDLQRELFSVLNHRIAEGKSVVISSDVPPTRLGKVEERLVSRLGGGVIIGLQMCEKQSLMQILKSMEGGENISDEVAAYFAVNACENVREFKAAVRQLIALHKETKEPVSIEMAKSIAPISNNLIVSNLDFTSKDLKRSSVNKESTMQGVGDRAAMFKDMLDAAENEEEQSLALQIALGEKLRMLREDNGNSNEVLKLENSLELLREGRVKEAMACINTG